MDSSEVKTELVNYYDNMVENINKLVEINVDLFKNLDDSTKLEKMFLFHNTLDDEDIFNIFSFSKLKVFSSKAENTLQLSNSLLGEDFSLKFLLNNRTDIIKSKIWIYLFKLYNLIETNRQALFEQESRQERITLLETNIEESTANLSKKVKSNILSVDVNDTTSNMLDDIVGSFQNLIDNNSNPFANIMTITNQISEKYGSKMENGEIELDKVMGSIQNTLPNMEGLMGKAKEEEKVIIDENFSTSQVKVEKTDENKAPNLGNMMNMMNQMPDIGGLTSMLGKLKDAKTDNEVQNLKSEMDNYLENELGIDVNELKENVNEISKSINDN